MFTCIPNHTVVVQVMSTDGALFYQVKHIWWYEIGVRKVIHIHSRSRLDTGMIQLLLTWPQPLVELIKEINIITPQGGWEIAQSLASLSTKRGARVRSRLDPLVTERWNSITVLLTRSHQCRRLVQKRPSMCYYVCVIMHVKDPQLSVVRVGHCVPLAGFCLSLCDLHALKQGR